MDRLGHDNVPLDRKARSFLQRFRQPFEERKITGDERALTGEYLKELFLVRLRGC